MYLLKAKKRVVSGPSPVPAERDRILPPNYGRYKNRQPQIDTNGKLPGIIKHCKYIGTFKVVNGLSSEARATAIKQQLAPLMAEYKSKWRKDYKDVALQMLDQGVKVLNRDLSCVLMAHALSRISYSVAEPKDGLLAFAAKDPEGLNNSHTYCHAFIFDNPKEASEINTTLGNAFRLAYCKRTLKRRTKCDTRTNSSGSSTGESAILRSKRLNLCPNQSRPGSTRANCHNIHNSASKSNNNAHLLTGPGVAGERVLKSPAFSQHDRSKQQEIAHLRDLDPDSRIKDWLSDASPLTPDLSDASPTYSSDVPGVSPTYPVEQVKGRCKRSGSCQPLPQAIPTDLRRPSRVADDQLAIPKDLKDKDWFQAGIPRHIALECLSMECEGAFIVRNSQTHKGCYALSLRGPGRGNSGTYHYLISHNSDGYFFQGGGRMFPDLTSLIHHHCYEKEGLVCKLSMNRNNPLFGDEPDSSDLEEEEEDPDYDQPPNEGFTTLLPS